MRAAKIRSPRRAPRGRARRTRARPRARARAPAETARAPPHRFDRRRSPSARARIDRKAKGGSAPGAPVRHINLGSYLFVAGDERRLTCAVGAGRRMWFRLCRWACSAASACCAARRALADAPPLPGPPRTRRARGRTGGARRPGGGARGRGAAAPARRSRARGRQGLKSASWRWWDVLWQAEARGLGSAVAPPACLPRCAVPAVRCPSNRSSFRPVVSLFGPNPLSRVPRLGARRSP